MDYKEQIEQAKHAAEKWREKHRIVGVGELRVDCMVDDLTRSITDLLARAEAAEAELEQKKGYYHQMVDALAAVDSRDLEEAKAKLKAADSLCKRLDDARENANKAAAKWEGMYHMALERAEKAERERDAAVKELNEVAEAVDGLSDFIDEQVHPLVSYDIYAALRENADAISVWQYESEWRGQEEE